MVDRIVFYDGECGFCNKVVQFILQHETKEELLFCSLQSEFAIEFLRKRGHDAKLLNTLYFSDGEKVYRKSSAALKIIPFLTTKFQFLRVFWVLPAFLRNFFYDIIAFFRKKIMTNSCSLEKRNSTRFIA